MKGKWITEKREMTKSPQECWKYDSESSLIKRNLGANIYELIDTNIVSRGYWYIHDLNLLRNESPGV